MWHQIFRSEDQFVAGNRATLVWKLNKKAAGWPQGSPPLRLVKCEARNCASHGVMSLAVSGRLLAAARLWGLRGHRSDDPLEIGARSGIAVDRHMLRHIELQPLDVAE